MPVLAAPVLPATRSTDDVLAGRYRLLHRLPSPVGAPAAVWKAQDLVLARPVAVTLLPGGDRGAAAGRAAGRAGAVDCRPLVRVYDATSTYVVREWVDGRSLADLLADGPLPRERALELVRQVAAVLVTVHAAGATHGRLHPGNLLLTPAGQLRLTDTEVAAALHGHPGTPAGDVHDLRTVARALLGGGRRRDRTVPGAGETTAAGLLRALDAPPPPRRRAGLGWIALLVTVAALGAGGALLAAPAPRTAAAAPVPTGLVPVDVLAVRDLDPHGSPPQESPEQVGAATDGDPTTAWQTERYRTAAFGGLKPGVGLLVDLGGPVPVTQVQVELTGTGTDLELRAGQQEQPTAVVAAARDASGTVALTVPPGTEARYWSVWLTALPPDAGRYRAGIAELRLLHR